jgi:hypothetical protein
MAIHLCGLPEGCPKANGPFMPLCLTLLHVGIASRPGHPERWCALTAPLHPYL